METDINDQIEGMSYLCTLPELGWPKEKVLQEIDSYMSLGKPNVFKNSYEIFFDLKTLKNSVLSLIAFPIISVKTCIIFFFSFNRYLILHLLGMKYSKFCGHQGDEKMENNYLHTQRIENNFNFIGAFKAEKGALSGTCHKPPELSRVEVVVEAYGKTAFANPLNPDA